MHRFFNNNFLYIFSITTIASSMIIPIDKVKAVRVKIFKVWSLQPITAKTPNIDTGREIAAMIVKVKFLKNTNTIKEAKKQPKIKSN